MRVYDWSSVRSADAVKKSAVAKPSVKSSTGANSSYASEERFWLWWKRAQLVAVLSSQARAPCCRASSSDLRKSASADIILSGPLPFKIISAVARSVSAAHQTFVDQTICELLRFVSCVGALAIEETTKGALVARFSDWLLIESSKPRQGDLRNSISDKLASAFTGSTFNVQIEEVRA